MRYLCAQSQKIERIRESLNNESQSSVARRQASYTSIKDELTKRADLETLEEKRTMDDFVKVSDQFEINKTVYIRIDELRMRSYSSANYSHIHPSYRHSQRVVEERKDDWRS